MTREILFLLLLSSTATAGDKPPIRLPEVPAVPQPMPAPTPPSPAPQPVTKLAAGEWYVIDADQPVLVLASPEGRVTITEDAGPVKLRGVFAGGTGKPESKTFTGKQVFTVEASHSGAVELLVVPTGATAAKDVIRRTIQVDAGEGPQPPPDVKPDDKPTLTAFEQKLQAAFKADKATPANLKTLAAFYKLAASSTAHDTGLTTSAALLKELQTAVKLLGIPPGSLNNVAKVVQTEFLDPQFKTPTNLTEDARAAFDKAFASLAASLEKVANGK